METSQYEKGKVQNSFVLGEPIWDGNYREKFAFSTNISVLGEPTLDGNKNMTEQQLARHQSFR